MTLEERFWLKVKKTRHCWIWIGARSTGVYRHTGYGAIKIDGQTIAAHRFAYLLLVGEIPRGKHVLHTCNNRSCVNPKHLYVGTHRDNLDDRNRKWRWGDHRLRKSVAQLDRKLFFQRLSEINRRDH